MSGREVTQAADVIRYRRRAEQAEAALEEATIKYVKNLHDLERDYEKNMRAKDAVIAELTTDLKDANDFISRNGAVT